MTGTKPGRASKDKSLTEGFNSNKSGNLSQRKLKQITKQAKIAQATLKTQRELDVLKTQLGDAFAETIPATKQPNPSKPDAADENDVKAAYQMLQDMRYVYKKVGGKAKLLKLMEEDDKQFVFMVKELMKIESNLMTAKSKENDNGSKGQMVFVVLKGLEDEIKLNTMMGPKDVDIKQITDALNPDGALIQVQPREESNDPEKW
jgi:hypothetical protein